MHGKKSFKYYSILIVTFCFFIFYFGCFFLNNSINIILPFVESDYGWSRGTVNAVITIAGLISIAGGFLTVSCTMKFGLKKVIAFMAFVAGLFTILMSQTEVFSLFALALAVLQIAAGAGFMVLPGFLMANWFMKKRGIMMGIATTGIPFSGVTCNTLVSFIMAQYSFGVAFFWVGIVMIILGVFCMIFVVDKPEDVGLAPDGISLTPEEVAETQKLLAEVSAGLSVKKMFRLKESWLYILAFGLLAMIMTGTVSQLVPRLMDAGYTYETATNFFALNALIGIPLSFVWGKLVDKTSVRIASVMLCGCFVFSSATVLFSSASNLPLTIVAMFFVGSLQGGLPNLETSILASIYGRVHFANANRTLRAGVTVFRSLGYSAMGLAYTYTNSYNISYIVFILCSIVAAVLILAMKGCYDHESPDFNRPGVIESL